MRDIRIGAAQFEHRNGDKEYNFSVMRALTAAAVEQGAEVVSFHESCITAYSFVRKCSRDELLDLAEPVPDGQSVTTLVSLAREFEVVLLAGLIEKDDEGRLYNTYVCVTRDGLVARHRKIHAFISQHLTSGNEYTVFDLAGVTFGILTCYDNNLLENVRITTLLGAEVIFMPHVTGCLPSTMPGRGLVARELWDNREKDPVRLRQEFAGPKGRGWLMRWLPARAYENGVYAVFSNPIGLDDDEIRNGGAMILDPYGEIIAESNVLGDDVVVALCTPEKIEDSPGRRYIRARRPDLYGKLVKPRKDRPVTDSGWGCAKET